MNIHPWTFVHVADMQPGSPRSFRFNPAWAENWRTAMEQIRQISPDLVLVGGDLTRDGSLHDFEFAAARADLNALGCPCHVIPGNMDTGNKHAPCQGARNDRNDLELNVTSEQIRRFARYFGAVNWTFVHKNVRFTGFYEALAGSGLPEEDEMWQMLEKLRRLPRADHHVVITHYPLFLDTIDDQTFDLTNMEEYILWYFSIDREHRFRIVKLLKAAGVNIIISGHIHCFKKDVVDGVRYIKAPATAMSQLSARWPDTDGTMGFLQFKVTKDGIRDELIPLQKISTAKGYGPGGHPKPEKRDYSIAWEK
ncbi:metallophosphoesterase family protein [Verrucomicrobiota bacterium]